MPERFFIEGAASPSSGAVIDGALAHHIARSLRMRPGEMIIVVDGAGDEHGVLLRSISADHVEGDVRWTRRATGEPQLRITVIQALPRDRMDDCIDVLVEAGAAAIRPAITERVVSRPADDRIPHRLLRWQAIAREAAQLAGRGIIPPVHAPVAFADTLRAVEPGTRLIACTFDGAMSLAEVEVDAAAPIAVCIGPEGGFGAHDWEALRAAGAETAHMGARVLRTRYAGAIACALLLGRSGDLARPPAAEPPG
jgi:16S rRNA (uracil1498-N3)-methyltransferase